MKRGKTAGHGRFPVTPWTLIGKAADDAPDTQPGRHSLGNLVELYRQPLLDYLGRRHGLKSNEADDVLAGFVANRMVHGKLLNHADRERGRFRTLLLVALDHHVIDEHRAQQRQVAHDRTASVEDSPDRVNDAQRLMERAWAKQVLSGVIAQVAKHCLTNGRSDVWLVLEQRVILPALDGLPPVDNSELAARLGLDGQGISNLLVTGKRLFIRTLREAVARYANEGEIDDEIRDLWTAFSHR